MIKGKTTFNINSINAIPPDLFTVSRSIAFLLHLPDESFTCTKIIYWPAGISEVFITAPSSTDESFEPPTMNCSGSPVPSLPISLIKYSPIVTLVRGGSTTVHSKRLTSPLITLSGVSVTAIRGINSLVARV